MLATLTIDTTGITTGQFDLLLNPPATGPTAFADTGVVTNLTNGLLQIGAAPTLTGDYNGNSIVDAADYVLWRETLNQTGPGLAADGNGNNQVDAADYELWRTNFGRTPAGAGSVEFHRRSRTLIAFTVTDRLYRARTAASVVVSQCSPHAPRED